MKIALVQPPHYYRGTVKDRGVEHFIPLGLLALHAALKGKHAASIINLNFASDARKLREDRYDVVGIRCASMDRDYTVRLVRELGRDRGPVIVVGGPHAALCPEDLLGEPRIDYVVRGAGEEALPHLLEALEGSRDIESVEGLCFRRRKKMRIADIAVIADMDGLPLPSYSALDLDRYLPHSNGWLPYETSRGCAHRCLYCSVWKTYDRIYAKSIPKVMSDLEAVLKLHAGVEVIGIEDSTFNFSRRRVSDFCGGLARLSRKLKRTVRWKATMRADRIDEDQLVMMQASGLAGVFVGFETASQRSLDRLRKDQDIPKMLEVVELFVKHRVPLQVSFQLGLPWETADEMWATVRLASMMQRKGVQTALLKSTLLPGTDIARFAGKRKGASGEEYSLNFPGGSVRSFPHPHVSGAEMNRMLAYYRNERKLDCFIANKIFGRKE